MGSKVIRNITKVFRSASGVLFGRVTSGTGRGEELTPSQVRSLLSVLTSSEIAAAYQPIGSYAAASHVHGNITNAGAIGSTATLPIITGASGVLQAGSFGTTVGTFCQGNDSRLSDSRTPTAHTHTSADITGFGEAVDDEVASLLVAGTNISISYNDAANTLTITNTASGLSGTGSVDNAVLRADGTGGATLQNSNWIINDNLTASPNNTVNHACLEATGGTTNVSVSIKPKGSGSFSLHAPDGTATGGNARGANAVDLQTKRSAATQVASGADSFAATANGTASGTGAVAFGGVASGNYSLVSSVIGAAASGAYSVTLACSSNGASGTLAMAVCGDFLIVSGTRAFGHGAIPGIGGATVAADTSVGLAGGGTVAGADNSVSIGPTANTRRFAQFSHSSGRFAAMGDCQTVETISRNVTTSATATELFLNGSSSRFSIQSGTVVSAIVRVVGVKSDGSEVIKFLRDVTIKNVGGTTSLEAGIVTIGTDINVSAATLDLSADNANDTLKIAVTPPAGTWRWMAVVTVASEIAYGT